VPGFGPVRAQQLFAVLHAVVDPQTGKTASADAPTSQLPLNG
jgi:hypothetical protein